MWLKPPVPQPALYVPLGVHGLLPFGPAPMGNARPDQYRDLGTKERWWLAEHWLGLPTWDASRLPSAPRVRLVCHR
ncbi:hypothetical protein F6B41_23450 [Microbacterium lushaniae]|nr:hypothetical protein F6B41_23450 [Microbacterium lushaniae]